MDEDTFLEGLAEDPADRNLRAVYADWLEDRGDPRAEFLRLSELLESLPVTGRRASDVRRKLVKLGRDIPRDWIRQVQCHGRGHCDDVKLGWMLDLALELDFQGNSAQSLRAIGGLISTRGVPADLLALAHLERGEILQRLGRIGPALADYSFAIDRRGASRETRTRAMCLRGRLFNQRSEFERAIADFSNALSDLGLSDWLRMDAMAGRGDAHFGLGQYRRAANEYLAVLGLPWLYDANRCSALLQLGLSCLHLGELGLAITYLTDVLECFSGEDTETCRAFCWRGVARSRRGDREEAMPDFAAALSCRHADPSTRIEAQFMRAIESINHGDLAAGVADLNQALARNPLPHIQARMRSQRGLVLHEMGKTVRAIADFDAAIESNLLNAEDRAEVLLTRGASYEKRNELALAEVDYLAVARYRGAPVALRSMGWCCHSRLHFMAMRFRECAADARKAIALNSRNGYAHCALGGALLFMKRPEKAIVSYDVGLPGIDSVAHLKAMAVAIRRTAQKRPSVARLQEALDRIECRTAQL